MGDWPQTQISNRQIIETSSLEAIGADLASTNIARATAAWPVTNLALFVPAVVYAPFVAVKMAVFNGATVSGNIDVGIYDLQGNRLVSSGSTAHAGTSAIQSFDITDTWLLPGAYYLAVAMDNTTGILESYAPTNAALGGAYGVLQMASAFALPATATFAALSNAYIPAVMVTSRTLI